MVFPPPHIYRREARERGLDEPTIARALEVARTTGAHGASPVFTLNHLAELTGASYHYLRTIVAREIDPYLSIDRPKGDGRFRAISSPEPVLMDVQRWILHNIVDARAPHSSSFAYRRGMSIVDCASAHIGARWLVKLDIHNFFPSIRERHVFPIFVDIGYPRLLSLELTRLCTRSDGPAPAAKRYGRYGAVPPYDVYGVGRLPQGAPTSGALANLVMADIDAELASYADGGEFIFTRYSDDIVFSGTGDFSREQAAAAIRHVALALRGRGLDIHRAKTRVVTPGARKIVLGLLIDTDRVRLLPEFKRRVETHIRGVEKFGLAAHAEHRRFESILSMINHVNGCLAFARDVDASYAEERSAEWAAALRSHGYPR